MVRQHTPRTNDRSRLLPSLGNSSPVKVVTITPTPSPSPETYVSPTEAFAEIAAPSPSRYTAVAGEGVVDGPISSFVRPGTSMSVAHSVHDDYVRHRKDPRNYGLDLCKQAISNIVGDMREEIQNAVTALQGSDCPAVQRQKVAKSLQDTEQESLDRLRVLLSHSNWELGLRLDQQLQWNENVSEHINDMIRHSTDSLLEVLNRLETKVVLVDDRLQRVEARICDDILNSRTSLTHLVETSSNKLSSGITGLQEQEQKNFCCSHDLLSSQMRHSSDHFSQLTDHLDRTNAALNEIALGLKSQMDEMNSQLIHIDGQSVLLNGEISDQIRRSDHCFDKVLLKLESIMKHATSQISEVQQTEEALQTCTQQIWKDIKEMQQQEERRTTEFRLSFETQMAEERVLLQGLKSNVDGLFDPLHADLVKTRRYANSDFRLIRTDLARIHQAMNLDFEMNPPAKEDEDPEIVNEENEQPTPARFLREYFTQTEEEYPGNRPTTASSTFGALRTHIRSVRLRGVTEYRVSQM